MDSIVCFLDIVSYPRQLFTCQIVRFCNLKVTPAITSNQWRISCTHVKLQQISSANLRFRQMLLFKLCYVKTSGVYFYSLNKEIYALVSIISYHITVKAGIYFYKPIPWCLQSLSFTKFISKGITY